MYHDPICSSWLNTPPIISTTFPQFPPNRRRHHHESPPPPFRNPQNLPPKPKLHQTHPQPLPKTLQTPTQEISKPETISTWLYPPPHRSQAREVPGVYASYTGNSLVRGLRLAEAVSRIDNYHYHRPGTAPLWIESEEKCLIWHEKHVPAHLKREAVSKKNALESIPQHPPFVLTLPTQ